jgi:hypothetical protein
MSVRTGMYHVEVYRTARRLYPLRYVLACTSLSTYHLVLPCTRGTTGFQMYVQVLRVHTFILKYVLQNIHLLPVCNLHVLVLGTYQVHT